MKVSFSTLGCPAWSLTQILDAASRLGYDGVELRFIAGDDALWARPELSGSGLTETRQRLEDLGLAVSCVDTRSFFHDPPGALRERALEEARRSLALAAELGAAGIRVFGDKVQPGQDRPSTIALIAEALDALGQTADALGVEAWLETHGDFAAAAGTLEILERVASRSVGVVWDPANAFERGEAPAQGHAILGPRIRHVHVKDMKRPAAATGAPWTPVLPGDGDFAPERVISVLEQAGYDRWVSFEWEKRWHPAIAEPDVALPSFARWIALVRKSE